MVNDRLNSAQRRTILGLLTFAVLLSCDWIGLGKAQSQPAGQAKQLARSAAKAASEGSKGTVMPSAPKVNVKQPTVKEQGGGSSPESNAPATKMASEDLDMPSVAGRRDPFKLPVVSVTSGRPAEQGSTGPLPPGIRGLVIGQLRLEGTVRQDTTNAMIAVVTNSTNRAYFLRENDAVYNGVVGKISPDAVNFKENVLDANGRVTTREVIRRLGQAAGEGR